MPLRSKPLRSSATATDLRPWARALLRVLAATLVATSIGACSLFGDKDAVAPDEPAERLYNEGVFLLNERKDYKEAAKKFEEVERQHPYSEWARKSLIMATYSYYSSASYEEAITAAQRYITLHPGNPDAAYAQYLIGSSYYDQIPDITRDQGRTEKALSALDEVLRKYPSSEYASAARKKIEFGRDQLAAREMNIGRESQNKKNFIGAINRFKTVVTQYQTTRHVEEALERLTECYMTLGIVTEAQTAAAVLGHNFPDSPWYKNAYALLKSGGTEPAEDKGSWISKAFKKLGVGALFSPSNRG
jgi:outer membrane protein assembly factor BamD